MLPTDDTTLAPRSAETLARLLDAELDFDPTAKHGFTNHLAMGLTAAARLGADPVTLQRWYEHEAGGGFIRRRIPRPAELAATTAEIERRGIEAVVTATLPGLVERVGGLFHWMIRLDLGLDAAHPGQVANALRDWAARPVAGFPFPQPSGSATVAEMLDSVAAAATGRDTGIDEHLAAIEQPWLRDLVARVADPGDADTLLAEIAAAVANLYWAANSFVTLHMVTGTRAARALAPLLDPASRTVLARGHLLAIASARARDPAPAPLAAPLPAEDRLPSWERMGDAAVATGDDHIVKLTYAARLEHEATGSPMYPTLAARITKQTAD